MTNDQIHNLSRVFKNAGLLFLFTGLAFAPFVEPPLLGARPLSWTVTAIFVAIGAALIGAAFWMLGRQR